MLAAQERYLASHVERQVQAALICHMPPHIAGHIFSQLCRLFAGRAQFSGPFPVYAKLLVEQLQPQLILSTVDTKDFRSFSVPAVILSPQLLPDDFHRIELEIRRLLETQLYS